MLRLRLPGAGLHRSLLQHRAAWRGLHRKPLIGRASTGRIGPRPTIDEGRVDEIVLVAHIDLGRLVGDLEIVVAFLEVPPKVVPFVALVLGHVRRRHAERIGLHLECGLAAGKRLAREDVDLLDDPVGHGVAARRLAVAMHHDVRAGATVGPIIGVGETYIEREVVFAVRVHLRCGDEIEPFGSLAVALVYLGSEAARPVADRISLEEIETSVVFCLPDLKLQLGFEDAYEDGRVFSHALLGEKRPRLGRQRSEIGWRELATTAERDD